MTGTGLLCGNENERRQFLIEAIVQNVSGMPNAQISSSEEQRDRTQLPSTNFGEYVNTETLETNKLCRFENDATQHIHSQ